MSWQQYVSILQEAKQLQAEQAAKDPVACPNDGTALESGPDGNPWCPFDGWRPR